MQNQIIIQKQASIESFTQGIYARLARASLLKSALKRNLSEDEILKRKYEYDEEFFNWNKHQQSNLLLIRSTLEMREYSNFEDSIQKYLVIDIFQPLDRCLTQAYDYRIKYKTASNHILQRCESDELINRALNCGYAVTNELFKLTYDKGNQDTSLSLIADACTTKQ